MTEKRRGAESSCRATRKLSSLESARALINTRRFGYAFLKGDRDSARLDVAASFSALPGKKRERAYVCVYEGELERAAAPTCHELKAACSCAS